MCVRRKKRGSTVQASLREDAPRTKLEKSPQSSIPGTESVGTDQGTLNRNAVVMRRENSDDRKERNSSYEKRNKSTEGCRSQDKDPPEKAEKEKQSGGKGRSPSTSHQDKASGGIVGITKAKNSNSDERSVKAKNNVPSQRGNKSNRGDEEFEKPNEDLNKVENVDDEDSLKQIGKTMPEYDCEKSKAAEKDAGKVENGKFKRKKSKPSYMQ